MSKSTVKSIWLGRRILEMQILFSYGLKVVFTLHGDFQMHPCITHRLLAFAVVTLNLLSSAKIFNNSSNINKLNVNRG